MTEVQILGGKRVVGLMPEASAFGGLCIMFLGLIYFFRHAMTHRVMREQLAPALVFLLLLFVWLSTSSSAYVGLFVFLLMAVIEWGWRKSSRAAGSFRQRGLGFEFWSALATLIGLGLVILVNPGLLDPIIEKVNEMVFNKAKTSSYEERSMWTAVSWQALLDTWGWGVGIGATRTSNFAAAVFSNTGLIGGLLYFAFVVQTLRRKAPAGGSGVSRAMLSGVRYAYMPTFIVGLLSATTPDFGSFNAFLYGAALAVVIGDLQGSRQSAAGLPSFSGNPVGRLSREAGE